MQILYVGNGNYNYHGARYYDVGRKLLNGFIRNGHNLYFLSDRDTARAATIIGSRKLGGSQCNRAFVATCDNYHPELIILGHADIISTASLETVRRLLPDVKIAQFNVDPLFRPENVAAIQSKLPYVDATFVTTGGPVLNWVHHPQGLACYIPNPIDSSIEWPRSHTSSDQPNDVFWALRGGRKPIKGDPRTEFPLHLEKDSRVKIDYHGMNGKKPLFGFRYYEAISRAKMGLNISIASEFAGGTLASSTELFLYSSDRIAQYLGSGLLVLTTADNSLEELFHGDKEIVLFTTKHDLLDKVIYYKEHPEERKSIAQAGWSKAHSHFNEMLVTKYIIERTCRLPLSEDYAWPTDVY